MERSSGNASTAASKEATQELLAPHEEWLESRGLSADLARRFGLTSMVRSFEQDDGSFEQAQAIAVPYVERGKVVNHKYRRTSKRQNTIDKGGVLTLWNHDVLLEQSDKPVVITEGEWDALTAALLGWRAVSVPNGTPNKASDDPDNDRRYGYLWRAQDLLNQVKSFIIAVDDDAPGHALRQDLIALLGADRCSFVEHYGADCKDLNDTLRVYGVEAANQLLLDAKAVPIRGLYKIEDYPDPGELEQISINIPGLNEMIYIVPATLTVMTGWAGQGKSTLLARIIAELLRRNIHVTLAAFETKARPILQRKLRAALIGCNEFSIPVTQIAWADDIIRRNLTLIGQMVGEEQEMSLEDVLGYARVSIQREGSRVVILDPWNEIEHKRRPNESETEYTSRAIRAVRYFLNAHNVAFWIVAHPSKPESGKPAGVPGLYSISGSSHWANKPEYGLSYIRPLSKNADGDLVKTNLADVHVTKVRDGMPGREGVAHLEYDFRTSSFHEARR